MDMTIKQAMDRLGLSVHTVRHYCDCGLVPNLRHDKNGNRLFDEESLKWLGMAAFLRSCNVPIAEVKRYFDLCLADRDTIRERCEILAGVRDAARAEAEAAQRRLQVLEERVGHCEAIIAGDARDDANPLNWRDGVVC